MARTQVYLTEREKQDLAALSRATGRKQSELIREAIDRFLRERSADCREKVLDEVAGIWRDRDDLLDFDALRRSWDRVN